MSFTPGIGLRTFPDDSASRTAYCRASGYCDLEVDR